MGDAYDPVDSPRNITRATVNAALMRIENSQSLRKKFSLDPTTRFLLVFCATALLGFALQTMPWVDSHIVGRFISANVYIAGETVRLLGGMAEVINTILRDPVSGFSVRVASGCSGLEAVVLLVAGMVAFPASWSERIAGWVVGAFAILSLNLVRIISLFYLGQYSKAWFDWAHLYAWDVIIMIDGMVIFFLWIRWLSRNERPNAFK